MVKRSAVETFVRDVTGCKDRESLEQWQLWKLREMLRHAKQNSRFYREHLKDIDPDSIGSLSDLAAVPFTSAEDLRRNPEDWLCLKAADVQRIVTLKTSGTKQDPKRVFFSGEEIRDTQEFFAEGMTELSGPGDKVMVLFPCDQPDSVGDLLAKAVEQRGVPAVRHGIARDLLETAEEIRSRGCTVLAGLPVQILGIAEILQEKGLIRTVLLSADAAPVSLIRRIEDLLGCKVFNHFGMTELGYGTAVECGAHNGCHLKESDFIVELIDPETGLPQTEGKPGEFVFTTLRRNAMPFIRYRSGDLGYLFRGVCECGSMILRIQPWGGRRSGKHILLGNRRLTQWELDEILFSIPGVVDYEVTGDVDRPELHLYVTGEISPEAVRKELAYPSRLGNSTASMIRITAEVKDGFTGRGMQKRDVAGQKK